MPVVYMEPLDLKIRGKVDADKAVNVSGTANVNNTSILEMDCAAVKSIVLELYGTFVATVSFQGAMTADFARPFPVNAFTAGGGTSASATSTAAGIFVIPTKFRFVRARITAFTSGMVSAQAFGSSAEIPPYSVGGMVVSSGTITNAPNTSSTANSHALVLSTASTNATSVKASAGTVMIISLSNSSASWRYFKLYNKASAPAVGSDVPVGVFGIAPGGVREIDCGAFGIRLSTGIAYAITGAAPTADTTAIVANDVHGHIAYA